MLVPIEWFSEYDALNLEAKELSKESVKLQQYGHIVKNSSLYTIAGLLMALIILLVGESIIRSEKIENITAEKEALFQRYKLKSTILQNRSLQNKYKGIYTKQSKLREYISYFLSMHLTKNQHITLIEYRKSLLIVNISGVRAGGSESIEKTLQE
ncbi:MAG: hypothetical protein Q9M40_02360 [Sulfurimonas sp.]|nr:hypothetical protein [Sulfurimonas sp.]